MKRKLIAGLLVLALMLSLFGCQKGSDTQQTQPSETTALAPDPMEVYGDARAQLEAMASVTLDLKQVQTTTVEGQDFVEEAEQVLTYSGLDTDTPLIRLEEQVEYILAVDEEEEEEASTGLYSELYTDGKVYIELEDAAAFSADLSAEECAQRYIPVVLLDASIYEELTLETTGEQTSILFDAATQAEAWTMPEDAQLLDASGSVQIGADGKIKQMDYAITYQYGPAQICLEVESKPREQAQNLAVPEDTQRYSPIESVDALKLTIDSENLLKNTQTVRLRKTESITSEAAGFLYENAALMELHDENELLMKIENATNITDAVNGSQSMTRVETFQDGMYVVEVDDGIPTSQAGLKEAEMREYAELGLSLNVANPAFWENVTVEDLGSVYLLEYDYSEDFGNSLQNAICTLFFGDMAALNSLASAYSNNAADGYMAVDKYTGLVTASGVYYEGVHTIQGDDYLLNMQVDQAIELPAFGTYKAITDRDQAEEEPEQKATPLFYHVTGTDGQEMWLFGTIHVGDTRTGYLPQEIYDAFAASDALALEMDQQAFETQLEEDEALMTKVAEAYYYTDGSTTEDHLLETQYALALKYLKASGNYSASALYMKPSLWQSSIENFYLQQGHQLHSQQGVEMRLTELAQEQEKPIREVESGLEQIRLLTGFSEELQQLLLTNTLGTGAEEYAKQTYELYEMWCAGDEQMLRQALYAEDEMTQLALEMMPLLEEYNQAIGYERNEQMLEVAIDYLESDEVIFFAVGLAHLLEAENGLVDALREAGYTVELVTYYQ